MASNLSLALYVKDVAKSIALYAKAFWLSRPLPRWGELESGQTTIAFTPAKQHETDDLKGCVQIPADSTHQRNPVEVCFDFAEIDAAFKLYMHMH